MKTRIDPTLVALALLALSTINPPLSTLAQGTAFTYQGRLDSGGSPANGVYDFTFQVFDAVTNGSSLGGTVNVNGVGVTNGLFTALVDLGSSPFTGPARWLQISVSTNGAGSFTALTPRQALTPTPYAILANIVASNSIAAANLQSNAITAGKIASGQVVKTLNGLTDAVSLIQGANVTINTVGNSLQISAPAGGLNLPYSGSASSSNSIFTLANSGTGPAGVFLGSVGVGVTNPASRLSVFTPAVGDGVNLGGNAPSYSLSDALGTHRVTLGYAGSTALYSADAIAGDTVLRTENGSAGLLLQNGSGASDILLRNHQIGIGTPTPQAKLDVRGDIALGTSGQLRATSGEENLRIVRGVFHANGTIIVGTGFTVAHPVTGFYEITFNPAFSGPPAVTATADNANVNIPWVVTAGVTATNANLVVISGGSSADAPVHFIAVGPR